MGGSGGGSTARYDPQRIKDLIRSAEDRTRDTGYETEISTLRILGSPPARRRP